MRKFNSEACVDTTHDVLYTHEVCVVADRHFYVHKHKKIVFELPFYLINTLQFPVSKNFLYVSEQYNLLLCNFKI